MFLPVNELQNLNFLDTLPVIKKSLAFSEAEVVFYKRNQVIFAQNDPVEYFGVVLEGLVAISKSSPLAVEKKQVIDIVPSHEFFGGLLITNRVTHYPVSVTCLSQKAKIILISKDYFQKAWLSDPDLMALFQKNIFTRVQSMQALKEIHAFSTEDKLKNALRFLYQKELAALENSSSTKAQTENKDVEFNLTRKQLGEICNTTTETTIRIFSQWHKSGLMFYEDDKEFVRLELLT